MDEEHFDTQTGEVVVAQPGFMPPPIAAAIIAVKKQIKQLGADDRNEHGKYAFVSVDKFYATVGKLMAEAGLALLIDETATDVRASDKSGNPWLFAMYDLTFLHESGALSHPLRRSIALPISGPQAFGAAQSYIEKQFLRQVFKVPTGERDADSEPTDGVAPESRNAGRTAQGGLWSLGELRQRTEEVGELNRGLEARSFTRGYQRHQAAPAPSDAKVEATRRWKELRDEIDACTTIPAPNGLDGIDGSPAWVACTEHVARAGDNEVNVMGLLRDRIEKRRAMLLEPEGGY